uniref:hypothetical protein n=1 Tax=Brucella intermedia TaxID=94625 RepID=UPI001AEEE350
SHSNGCICLILPLALASIDDCYMEICDGSAFCDPLYDCSLLFTSKVTVMLNIGHCVLGKYGQTNRPVQAAENAKHFIAKY